jgi:hypothetical protein
LFAAPAATLWSAFVKSGDASWSRIDQEKGLSGYLEGDVDDALPVDGMSRRVRCGGEASAFHGANGGFPEAMAQVACDPENMDRTRGRDAKPN